jgi:hypothetical protein
MMVITMDCFVNSNEAHEVAILGDSDFTTYVEANPSTLVMFYAPVCRALCAYVSSIP